VPLPRLIPCLDVAEGRVVKGVRFQGLRDAGDPRVQHGWVLCDLPASQHGFHHELGASQETIRIKWNLVNQLAAIGPEQGGIGMHVPINQNPIQP